MKLTDKQVASAVRMLMRDQLDHEMICTLGRDRIIDLSKQLDMAERALVEVLDCILPKELEGCGMSPERVTEIEAIALLKKTTMETE